MAFSFEDLVVYQKAVDFVDKIYCTTKKFPRDELYGITSQLRRAAVSVSLNIAEGSARSKKDFNRFLDIARGSVFECFTILKIYLRQGYVDKKVFDDFHKDLEVISKMVSGLNRSLKE